MIGKWLNAPIGLMFLFLLSLIVCSPERSAQAESRHRYRLQELYRLALERSEEVQIAQNNLLIARKDEKRAFSALVPTLSGFGDYIRYNEAGVIQPESGYDYGLKLQQQFTINGRELKIFRAAKDTTEQRRYDLNAVKEGLLFRAAAAFYDVANNNKRVEILKENVKRLQTHKASVIKHLKLEEVPKTDLLRTEAELSGTKSELVRAQNALVYARSSLASLLDLPRDYQIEPPALEDETTLDGTLDQFVKTALKNRPDMKAAQMAVKLAAANVDITKSQYWPMLSLEAGYQVQETDPSFLEQGETLYAGANVNMILFDWGMRSAAVGQEKVRKRNAELQLASQTKLIALEVEQAYLAVITAQSAIKALKDKLESSRVNFEAVSLQFNLGQADSLDVMDANTILANSERELSEAQFDLALAMIGLKRAQGIFLKEVKSTLF